MSNLTTSEITDKIIKLKLQPQTVKTKREIQKLQQELDNKNS